MYLNINKHSEARNYAVFDKETGEEIKGVVWADDVRMRFSQYKKDKKGRYILNNEKNKIVTVVRTDRKIELRKIR